MVIGYGTTTVKDATGSVAVVNSEDFNQGGISSPEQLIQGKTAGVQITQSSGEPGAGINIRIRGTASVRSNNNPLFVVDGVPWLVMILRLVVAILVVEPVLHVTR